MKTLFPLLFIFILASCSTSWDPPPQGYKIYQTRKTNDEQIKQDMKECGFPDVHNNNHYFVNYHNEYVASSLCMESKGYRNSSLPKGVCYRYPDSSPCQDRQKNPK